ncbi:hypothetical protein [Enterobacter cloacae]|uniref:hypothetical protein n=1 Tax=Enterobacter cloacae TaxID=550 RepID=UPI0015969A79|nr:hypothetical protein [Enterobacter cloacae]
MDVQDSSEQTASLSTVSVSLKGIPADQGLALKEVAKAHDINQSALLREMVSASMVSLLSQEPACRVPGSGYCPV